MARSLASPQYLSQPRWPSKVQNATKPMPPCRKSPMAPTFRNGRYEKGEMKIQESASYEASDEMSLEPWKRRAFRLLPLTSLLFLSLVAGATYFQVHILRQQYREGQISRASLLTNFTVLLVQLSYSSKSQHPATVSSADFTGTDVLHAIARLIALFGKWRPRLQMVGQKVPTVDVLIPCCNEDPDIIIDTTRAVLQMDYPRNRYRVLITDDGNSRELACYVEQLATEYPNLHYTARKKIGPDGFKAGNLNHALSFLSALPEGAAEFVASLDADMIPDKRWLRALVPHLVRDPQLAVVCPPQHFYNAPVNDALCQANRYFGRSFEILKDMAGAAWNTGSGWITRREALDSIGGWPTDSITEDAYCSTMLLAAGWKAAYVQEELQHGLVPDSYYKHIKQRTRWNVGGAQRTANMGFFLRKAWARKFTAGHRFFHMLYSVDYFSPILLCLGILVTPICLFMGSKLAPYQDISQLRLMLQLKCLVLLAGWLNDLHNSLFIGYQVGLSEQASRVWMSPYHMITLVRSFILPSCLGGQLSGFTATGSVPDTLHERRPDQRAPLSKRLQHILTDCGVIFHLGFIILCSLGIANMVYQCFGAHGAGSSHSWMLFLSNLALPLPFWYQLIIGCFVPLQYAIFPPDVPEREACLFRDPVTGVAYPTQKAKEARFTLKKVDYAHFHFPIVLYAISLFASTWWI